MIEPQPEQSAWRGIRIRTAQLCGWSDRIRDRLLKLQRLGRISGSSGLLALYEQACREIDGASRALQNIDADVNQNLAAAGDDEFLGRICVSLDAALASILIADELMLPVLETRSPSDNNYDAFLTRFLKDLNLAHFDPVSCHKQCQSTPVAVDDRALPAVAIFQFLPSVRSINTLSLLYHEIGHLFWDWGLSRGARDGLEAFVRQFGDDQTATQLQLSRPSPGGAVAWNVEEIAADVFAGLVGGYAYLTSFWATFMFVGRYERPEPQYPLPGFRAELCRRAAKLSGSPDQDLVDPLFSAWERVQPLTRSATRGLSLQHVNCTAVGNYVREMKRILGDHGVPLAGKTDRSNVQAGPSEPTLATVDSVPSILLRATKYRSACQSWEQYRKWERKLFARLGLTADP